MAYINAVAPFSLNTQGSVFSGRRALLVSTLSSALVLGACLNPALVQTSEGGIAVQTQAANAETGGGRESFNGIVEQVWEDGFRLNTGTRTLMVDSWDLYGDDTRARINLGQRLSVSGEFEGGEFDAFSIDIHQ